MNRLKFKTRIFIGFSLVLLFSLIIVVLAIMQIQKISSDTKIIYEHPFTVSNSVKDINININAIHRSMKDVAISENEVELYKTIELVNSYDSLVRAAFEVVKERFLGERIIVDDAYNTFDDWAIIRDEVIELKKAGNDIEAIKITKGRGADHVKLVFDKTKVLTDYADNKANELYIETKDTRRKSITVLLIIILILLVLGVVAAVVISKSVTVPIRQFINEINLIHKKRSSKNSEFIKKSETEILSETASELNTIYETLERSNIEIEQKVKERTEELNRQNEEYEALNEEYITVNEELFKTKEKIEERRTELQQLIDNMPTGFAYHKMIVDNNNKPVNYKFIEINNAFEKITGLKAKDLIGKEVTKAMPGIENDPADWIGKYGQVAATGKPVLIKTYSGVLKKWFSVNAYSPKKGYFATIFEDITDQKNHEEQLQLKNKELVIAREKAEESDRLKSAFLANMSHEIRTPMNAILGFSHLLKRKNISEEKREKYLELIGTGGERLLNIISDIVDISKIDANQLSLTYEVCHLNNLIDDLHSQFAIGLANKKVSLTTSKELSDTKSSINTDSTRLSQILSNLIENAQKFTKEGQIEFGYIIKDKMLRFYVKDTGIGIDKKDQFSVFERFKQVENNYSRSGSGTGLGLSIVKGLIELFKGKIWVDSELNKGATFYFTIPYNPTKQDVVVEEPIKYDDTKRDENITILIAEDDSLNFLYLSTLFETYHYKIIRAKNGKEAIEILNKNSSVNLVLMDVKMPVMSGLDATREIRKTNKDIYIIAQTAYALAEDREMAIKAGCNDYLSKPISEKSLIDIVNKFI